MPEEPSRDVVALVVAVLLIPAALGSSATIFNDGDVSWHIATGMWILDHRAIPHADPFSFTWLGKPWVPIEWLAEVLLGCAYRIAAHAGVAALVTAALIALHAIVFANARRWVSLALLPVVGMDFALVPMLSARPHVLVWPLLAGWVALLMGARAQDRAPHLAAALLLTLWANMHGSFVLGLALAGAFGLEALVSSPNRARVLRQWLPFGIACLLAVLINANGFAGAWHPFYMAGQSTLPMVDEWKPSNPTVTPFFFGLLAVTFALIAWKRPRLHPVRWAMLTGLLLLALWQVRHQPVLAIVAAMLLPQGFAQSEKAGLAADGPNTIRLVCAAAILLVAARALVPVRLPENEFNPWKLIAAVPQPLRSQPVLNGYSMGGPLILSGIRPFIDGRADMYGDAFVTDYARLSNGDAAILAEAEQRWCIRWAILPNEDHALISLLDRSGDWRRIANDRAGVIYVRRAPSA